MPEENGFLRNFLYNHSSERPTLARTDVSYHCGSSQLSYFKLTVRFVRGVKLVLGGFGHSDFLGLTSANKVLSNFLLFVPYSVLLYIFCKHCRVA